MFSGFWWLVQLFCVLYNRDFHPVLIWCVLSKIWDFFLSTNSHPTKWPSNNTTFSLVKCQSKTSFTRIIKESTRNSSDKWTQTLCQDYLHHIANVCANVLSTFLKKSFLKFTWKFLWTLEFIFSSSYGKLFLVLLQTIIYSFSF